MTKQPDNTIIAINKITAAEYNVRKLRNDFVSKTMIELADSTLKELAAIKEIVSTITEQISELKQSKQYLVEELQTMQLESEITAVELNSLKNHSKPKPEDILEDILQLYLKTKRVL